MSVKKIHLRKLLQLFFADARLQRSLLLTDIRNDRAKESTRGSGGDFYAPFWSDVKNHAAGLSDLYEQTEIRIAANKTRARLYPVLRDAFFAMWNEQMRWRNEAFQFVPESVSAQFDVKELESTVKIENTASVKIWDGSHRVIYPYFSESPALPIDGVRLCFWVLRESLPDFPLTDFRIIDFQRRAYFRPSDVAMTGSEREEFVRRYASLIDLWEQLRKR